MGKILAHPGQSASRRCHSGQRRGNYCNLGASLPPFPKICERRPPRLQARWATVSQLRVAAKLLFPEREVIAFAGDGCFLMNGQEFATAMPVRRSVRCHRRQQRHLRHDPHASGALNIPVG
jgi:hypothetical protein